MDNGNTMISTESTSNNGHPPDSASGQSGTVVRNDTGYAVASEELLRSDAGNVTARQVTMDRSGADTITAERVQLDHSGATRLHTRSAQLDHSGTVFLNASQAVLQESSALFLKSDTSRLVKSNVLVMVSRQTAAEGPVRAFLHIGRGDTIKPVFDAYSGAAAGGALALMLLVAGRLLRRLSGQPGKERL